MNFSGIKYSDMINGKGVRVSIFVSGCSHRCTGCFNRETWDKSYGSPFTDETVQEIYNYFDKYHMVIAGISLLGGDPTYHKNIEPLTNFIHDFKRRYPTKDIWIWSGFTWEQILGDTKKYDMIKLCDVLIDGKFMLELKDLNLKWRGSSNQRVIDIKKSILENRIITYENI